MANYTMRVIYSPQERKGDMGDEYWESAKYQCTLLNTHNPRNYTQTVTYRLGKKGHDEAITNLISYLQSIQAYVPIKDKYGKTTSEKIINQEQFDYILKNFGDFQYIGYTGPGPVPGGSRRRRRPSRKYKKSAKRVFRKKSRSTKRR